VHLKFLLPLR